MIGSGDFAILSTEESRYREAYWFYYLAMRRYLENMSSTIRYRTAVTDRRGRGGRIPYTSSQRAAAIRYKASRPFLEFDMANCLMHARILLDRAIALSRSFLTESPLPSFTSFHDHKEFFTRRRLSISRHRDYANYMCDNTAWFDMPLKAVRDKFVVHASPQHFRFMGSPNSHQVDLVIMVPAGDNPAKPMENVKAIVVNALRLSYEVETFLKWLADYGTAALKASSIVLQGRAARRRALTRMIATFEVWLRQPASNNCIELTALRAAAHTVR
jgi:hypothetical protein